MEPGAGHDRGADRTDRAGLVDRRDTGDDRAQHQQDQRQRRQQDHHDPNREPRIVAAIEMHRRRHLGAQQREHEDEDHVGRDQNEPWHQRAHEHVARAGRDDVELRGHGELAGGLPILGLAGRARLIDRARELVGENDQHDRRGNDLAERAGRRDRPGGERVRVVVAPHDGQRDQPHGHDGRADDAGGGGQQRADEDDGDAEAAGHRAEQLGHGDQQILGDPGPLQHDAHEHEQRNRDQRIPFDLPIDAAKIGDARGQPLHRSALGKIGTGIAGK